MYNGEERQKNVVRIVKENEVFYYYWLLHCVAGDNRWLELALQSVLSWEDKIGCLKIGGI